MKNVLMRICRGGILSGLILFICLTMLRAEVNPLVKNGPVYGSFKYGYKIPASAYGSKWTHMGLDIFAPQGAAVYPVGDGVVTKVIYDSAVGNAVMIEHNLDGKKVYSLYAHLYKKPNVKVGDKVFAGVTVLGGVGKTGAIVGTGYHLHFEIRDFDTLYPKWPGTGTSNLDAPGYYAPGTSTLWKDTQYAKTHYYDPEALFAKYPDGFKDGTLTGISGGNSAVAGSSSPSSNGYFGTIKVSALNVRAGAGVGNRILGSVYSGRKVEIVGESNGWYQIKYGSGTGWISGQYVNATAPVPVTQPVVSVPVAPATPVPPPQQAVPVTPATPVVPATPSAPSTPAAQPTILTGKVSSSAFLGLNVRAGAGTNFARLGGVSAGQQLQIISHQNGWYKIKYGNGTGWVSEQYVAVSTADKLKIVNLSAQDAGQQKTQVNTAGSDDTSTVQPKKGLFDVIGDITGKLFNN